MTPGERVPGTRWTYLGPALPCERQGRSRKRWRLRCACGYEAAVPAERVQAGRAHGCPSRACRHRFEAVEAIRPQLFAALENMLAAALRGDPVG